MTMPHPVEQAVFCTKADGYRGIWHGQTPTDDEYVYKYSGGLATYPHQHRPFAIYRPEVNKTFFCYGGTVRDFVPVDHHYGANQLLHMVSYYDHATGQVPRPTILLDKYCGDAHDNPVISIDASGYIWIFSPSHGPYTTPSFIHRSSEPYSIDRFETVRSDWLYAYPQVRYRDGGFVMMHTQYDNGRKLRCATSADGITWTEPVRLAEIEQGHYQVTQVNATRIGTAFNYHPTEGGLEARTNLYYMQSDDNGRTWTTVTGEPLDLPLTTVQNPALVRDYAAEGWLVYMKDMVFDADGHPVILYITSRGNLPGPHNDPRIWTLARWTGTAWVYSTVTESDSNYDMGPLYIHETPWRIIGPTETGPYPYNPGGEVAVWTSDDLGATWQRERVLTARSPRSHTFVRRVQNAHPDFRAFWADGNPRQTEVSHLYFSDGERVWRLPPEMDSDFAAPERVPTG